MSNLELYYRRKYDFSINNFYWELREEVQNYTELPNKIFIKSISNLLKNANGFYYKGAYMLFSYKNSKYYISLTKYTYTFLDKLKEILINNNSSNLFMDYGELD